jgi:hypothetical protein
MAIDADYGKRLKLLAELMDQDPKKPVRELQAECLKYYPLASVEAQRNWLSMKTAFAAAKIKLFEIDKANKELLNAE